VELLRDPVVGDNIGYIVVKDGEKLGPCCYGTVPFTPDQSSKQRIIAGIATRESPMRGSKPWALSWEPSTNCVQAYEANEKYGRWLSGGLCHAITRNGNFQKLLGALRAADTAAFDKAIAPYGLTFDGEDLLMDDSVVSDDDWQDPHVVAGMVRLLALPFTVQPQVDFFWGLITERDGILKSVGWYDVAMADERIRFIAASMAINMGTDIFKASFLKAKEKTAEALTASRIARYKAIGSTFGIERSEWEQKWDGVTDGRPSDA